MMHLLVALSVFQQSLNRKAPLFSVCCSACRYLLYLAFIPAIVVMCSTPFVNFVPYTQKSELATRPQFCTTGRVPFSCSSCLILGSKWFCTTGMLCSRLSKCLIDGSHWFWSSCLMLANNWFWSGCLILGSNWFWSTCLIQATRSGAVVLILGSKWFCSTRASGNAQLLLLLCCDLRHVGQQGMHSIPVVKSQSKLISLYPVKSLLCTTYQRSKHKANSAACIELRVICIQLQRS